MIEIDPGQCQAAWTRVSLVPENPPPLPDFTRWPSFPFEGDLRVKRLAPPVDVEPPRSGEDAADCVACNTPDDAYIWVSERWRVRAMDRPTGLPMVLILECRSHLDLGDLPNLLAAELGVMTVRLERAVRSLDGVARVHVNRWGDGSAHLHMWFLARPYGRLQLRGTFLSLWDDILPVIPELQWRENLAMVAAWLAEFGGRPLAEPPHIAWQSPGTISEQTPENSPDSAPPTARPTDLADVADLEAEPAKADAAEARAALANAPTRDLRASSEKLPTPKPANPTAADGGPDTAAPPTTTPDPTDRDATDDGPTDKDATDRDATDNGATDEGVTDNAATDNGATAADGDQPRPPAPTAGIPEPGNTPAESAATPTPNTPTAETPDADSEERPERDPAGSPSVDTAARERVDKTE
jgi:hypothetical protein